MDALGKFFRRRRRRRRRRPPERRETRDERREKIYVLIDIGLGHLGWEILPRPIWAGWAGSHSIFFWGGGTPPPPKKMGSGPAHPAHLGLGRIDIGNIYMAQSGK